MDSAVAVAVVSGLFTLAGSFAGVMASSRLTAYRMEQLEKRVDKHNQLVERMYIVEDRLDVHEVKLKVIHHRIEDLEREELV